MSDKNETYLGDGCYGSFDGYQIWLRVTRNNGDHEIALEPQVFMSLMAYGQRIWQPETPQPDTADTADG
jgi:hypothetical protein